VLCLGYKGWLIKEFFLNYRAMTADLTVSLGPAGGVAIHNGNGFEDWNVTLAETGDATQTGGRIGYIRRYVEGEELFCVTYGDGVSNIDISKLIAFHLSHRKIATVTAVRPPGRFGEMIIGDARVTKFNEKPPHGDGYINGGFFIFDAKRIWDYIPPRPDLVLEGDALCRLAQDGQLMAYSHGGFWQPMDTTREYHLLNDLWASGHAPWKTWGGDY